MTSGAVEFGPMAERTGAARAAGSEADRARAVVR
jgi:hypothetical protein